MGSGPYGWGPTLGGGQGQGPTHDMTGRGWRPEGQLALGGSFGL